MATQQTRVTPSESVTSSNRWVIPIAAVAIHICIGSVYAWSTFNRPIQALFSQRSLVVQPAVHYVQHSDHSARTERCLWRSLGGAPGATSGCGSRVHALRERTDYWRNWPSREAVGAGFLGYGDYRAGMGCGIGYIAPVSTLVKWFPDRRGMATGMAIMGFGGGAFLAGYLNVYFLNRFGVANTIMALGATYFFVMLIGAFLISRPPEGCKPEGWTPPVNRNKMMTNLQFTRNDALHTVQFYLLWGVLFINVTASIGILAQASPMMQDMFQKTALEAAAVVSLISLFNSGGRFFWASFSDYIGRRNTYIVFFVTQVILFLLIPSLAGRGQWVIFEAALFVVFTMYGGGFATIPAFLADMFGEHNVGAIHGALLTAWSAAAIAGPVIITELSSRAKANLAPGASKIHIYDQPLEVLAALLAVGFVLTLLVRPTTAAEITHAQ